MPKNASDYEVCSKCGGRQLTDAARTRSRKGGQAAYLKSLQQGQMSMSDRGKLGGRPRRLTLAEMLDSSHHQRSVAAPEGAGVQQKKG